MINQFLFVNISVFVILLSLVSRSANTRPNVLFILTEDQGAQLSFVKTPGISTPNMDRIEAMGVYFDKAFVNYPVCSASKANIYTGTYCNKNGLRGVTTNWHGNADSIPKGIANHPLTPRLRVKSYIPTLVEILQILSVNPFQRVSLNQLLTELDGSSPEDADRNQLMFNGFQLDSSGDLFFSDSLDRIFWL